MTRSSLRGKSLGTLPSRQRGLGILGWLTGLVVVGILGTMAINMIPAYMNDKTVQGSIDALLGDPRLNLMSAGEMKESLGKRFDVNSVTDLAIDDVNITRNSGSVQIGVDYNVEKHLFYNVSVVMHFKHDYTKPLASQ